MTPSSAPWPSTVTVPLIPAVLSAIPSKGTLPVSPRATVTVFDVVSKPYSSSSYPEMATA